MKLGIRGLYLFLKLFLSGTTQNFACARHILQRTASWPEPGRVQRQLYTKTTIHRLKAYFRFSESDSGSNSYGKTDDSVNCAFTIAYSLGSWIWDSKVSCPSYPLFRISPEEVSSGDFLPVSFISTVNSDMLLLSHTVFCLLYSRVVCVFRMQPKTKG